jgi:hypothetical protein
MQHQSEPKCPTCILKITVEGQGACLLNCGPISEVAVCGVTEESKKQYLETGKLEGFSDKRECEELNTPERRWEKEKKRIMSEPVRTFADMVTKEEPKEKKPSKAASNFFGRSSES